MGKVLVVDDAAYVRAKTARLLNEYGYETVEAGDGAEAVIDPTAKAGGLSFGFSP